MAIRVKIVGTGAYLPPTVVKNDDLKEYMDTSDEWIYERSGIRTRRYAEEGVTTSDLALEASKRALEDAGIQAGDVECIVLATLSPDIHFPGTGLFLQDKLGISERSCACYDVRAQCSGFLYATELATSLIQCGIYRTVLVVGSEIHSHFLEHSTRGRLVTVLFGDGAGAVVLQGAESDREDEGILCTEIHGDGRGALNGVHQKVFDMSRRPFLGYDVLDAEKNEELWPNMANPRGLYSNGVIRMSEVTISVLEKKGFTIDDVDWVLPHQANLHMIRDMAERVKLPQEKMLVNIEKYGNTSAATIPTLLDENVRNGKIKRGQLLVFTAFGSGFTWGAVLVRY
jgi:3-oxoacyl-[acyl-carrier-protein] synthase-3